jgi:transposase
MQLSDSPDRVVRHEPASCSGKYVLVTVHAKRGKDGMERGRGAAVVRRTACRDAWAPYDCYQDLAGHALCTAHLLRELTAVTDTGTADDVTWARQAIDAQPTIHGVLAGCGPCSSG